MGDVLEEYETDRVEPELSELEQMNAEADEAFIEDSIRGEPTARDWSFLSKTRESPTIDEITFYLDEILGKQDDAEREMSTSHAVIVADHTLGEGFTKCPTCASLEEQLVYTLGMHERSKQKYQKRIRAILEKLKLARQERKEMKGHLTSQDRIENDRQGLRPYSEAFLERIPPQAVGLEKVVLGSYMVNPKLMDDFSQPYFSLLLYKGSHMHIHKAMMELGPKLDFQTLVSHLSKLGILEECGGRMGLQELKEEGEKANHGAIKQYIAEIEEKGLMRHVITFCTNHIREMYEYPRKSGAITDSLDEMLPPMPEYVRNMSVEIMKLIPFRFRRLDISELTGIALDDFERLRKRNGRPFISTGYEKLDRIIHGIIPNRLVMVGARTSIGKTTFTLNIANNVARQGFHSLYFTYENSSKELVEKLLSMYSGMNSEMFVYQETPPTEEQIKKLEEAKHRVINLPIYFEDSKPDIEYIIKRSEQVKTMHPRLALVVVDALQSFKGYVPYQGNKSDIYYEVLKQLKNLAKELSISVIVNSQLKIDVEKRKNKKPYRIEDFSDCKGIPEVADSVFFLYRPEFYWEDDEKFKGWMSLIPAKMRMGEKKDKGFRLGTDMTVSRIYELEPAKSG
ncbi:AAA family ATPase [Candidatus Woesearchaeota archaeon]|nr:AAA family ATPase [Candidatus Woesearchaeota archaeon]